jgi:hypothetical protein
MTCVIGSPWKKTFTLALLDPLVVFSPIGFEYLDHLVTFKHVKDQVVVVLKGRRGWLKKMIEKNEAYP